MPIRKIGNSTTCRMRLVRNGVEFEAEGDRDFVLEMVKQFAAAGSSSVKQERTEKVASTVITSTSKGLSVREFIGKLESRKHTDLVLAFGYYLEKYMGQPSFTPADITHQSVS